MSMFWKIPVGSKDKRYRMMPELRDEYFLTRKAVPAVRKTRACAYLFFKRSSLSNKIYVVYMGSRNHMMIIESENTTRPIIIR